MESYEVPDEIQDVLQLPSPFEEMIQDEVIQQTTTTLPPPMRDMNHGGSSWNSNPSLNDTSNTGMYPSLQDQVPSDIGDTSNTGMYPSLQDQVPSDIGDTSNTSMYPSLPNQVPSSSFQDQNLQESGINIVRIVLEDYQIRARFKSGTRTGEFSKDQEDFHCEWLVYNDQESHLHQNLTNQSILQCMPMRKGSQTSKPIGYFGDIFEAIKQDLASHSDSAGNQPCLFPYPVREDNPILHSAQRSTTTPFAFRQKCKQNEVFYCLLVQKDSSVMLCKKQNLNQFYLAELGSEKIKKIEMRMLVTSFDAAKMSIKLDLIDSPHIEYLQINKFTNQPMPFQGPIFPLVTNFDQICAMLDTASEHERGCGYRFILAEVEENRVADTLRLPNESINYGDESIQCGSLNDGYSSRIGSRSWKFPKLFVRDKQLRLFCLHLARRQSSGSISNYDEFSFLPQQTKSVFGIPATISCGDCKFQHFPDFYKYIQRHLPKFKMNGCQCQAPYQSQLSSQTRFGWRICGFRIKNINSESQLPPWNSPEPFILLLETSARRGNNIRRYLSAFEYWMFGSVVFDVTDTNTILNAASYVEHDNGFKPNIIKAVKIAMLKMTTRSKSFLEFLANASNCWRKKPFHPRIILALASCFADLPTLKLIVIQMQEKFKESSQYFDSNKDEPWMLHRDVIRHHLFNSTSAPNLLHLLQVIKELEVFSPVFTPSDIGAAQDLLNSLEHEYDVAELKKALQQCLDVCEACSADSVVDQVESNDERLQQVQKQVSDRTPSCEYCQIL